MDDDNKWVCNLCQKTFTNRKNLWAHKNKTKTPCISKEQCEELLQKVQSKESRINYFKTKAEQSNQELEKKEKEIEYLKSLLKRNDELCDKICEVKESVDQVQDAVENKNQTFTCNQNLNLINNLTSENKNSIINIDFSKAKQEKLDHITHDMMMNILDHKNYNKSVGKLMQSIYFHPEAPQNWNWCVTDTDAQFGVLQYDHESGNLQRQETEYVIQKRYSNVMFRVVDMLEELRKARNFNRPQAINYNRMCNSLGTELDQEQVSTVKQVAYKGRNLSKSLWDYLDIMVETTQVPTRITLKHKKEDLFT